MYLSSQISETEKPEESAQDILDRITEESLRRTQERFSYENTKQYRERFNTPQEQTTDSKTDCKKTFH